MDCGFTLDQDNPQKNANILSKLLFTWMTNLFYKGMKDGLQVKDLYKTLTVDKSDRLTDSFEKYWNDEIKNRKSKKPNLIKALFRTFKWSFMYQGFLTGLLNIILRPFRPVILAYLINCYNSESDGDNTTCIGISTTSLLIISIVITIFAQHIERNLGLIGMRVRIAVSSLVYRKILKLDMKAINATATGQIINILSNDVQRFDFVLLALHYYWLVPVQVAFVMYLMWQQVELSAISGLVAMLIIVVPMQSFLAKAVGYIKTELVKRTDRRVELMSEMVAGIQVIKMYAWEMPFQFIIKAARKGEIKYTTQVSYLRGFYYSTIVFGERVVLLVIVVTYVLLGNTITADKVFSIAQFANLIQMALAIWYPLAIVTSAETLVAIRRLEKILLLDEMKEITTEVTNTKDVQLETLDAAWTSKTLTLNNIDIHFSAGHLCAIVGPVGSGKSSIFQVILGELKSSRGTCRVGGTISYASQKPWLFASTVRNNILFGQPYDKLHYQQVVKVCALVKDFEQLPQGDKTVVGDRGVALSGGQRARISLARAVYRNADIYLFDDPLSAVDTHVGKHLFEECILKHLRGKTRILITHQLQFLKNADMIVVLNGGKIEAQGTFNELSEQNLDFTKLLAPEHEEPEEALVVQTTTRRQSVLSIVSSNSEISEGPVTEKNEEEFDGMKLSPFTEYIKASGSTWSFIIFVLILIVSQVACSCADYWVTFWTEQEQLKTTLTSSIFLLPENETVYISYDSWINCFTNGYMIDNVFHRVLDSEMAIYIYIGIMVTVVLFTVLRSYLYFKRSMRASKNLHNTMFGSVLRAPMRFFDTNPSGRILNRFSKDIGSIDDILSRVLFESLQIVLVTMGILVLIVVANYYMAIVLILLTPIFWKIRTWYVTTAKNIKHLEGITKSPVFSQINSTINGIVTIRVSQTQEVLKQEFDHNQDVHTSAWYLILTSKATFGLWLDLLCSVFVAIVAYSFFVLYQFDSVNSSLVGLAISQSLILTGMLQIGIGQTAEVISQLTSVERVLHYTKLEDENIKQEHLIPDDSWPSKGCIEFVNLFLRYSLADAPVLKGLTLKIEPGQKIGIVGRTGAGKSSLISALFRLAPIEGSVLIDGIDTKELNLKSLRKKISIIPQEPVLFSETLRYNLDPFNEFDDAKLWNVLEQVELKDAIQELDMAVAGGGSNFSIGQRQLVCLARAILRNNQILVLDEATANIDHKTDALIQSTIRREFGHCTVLTIAHRLNTIMDSDKIMVMDAGVCVEFDHPHVLLENSNGHFSKMVEETGPSMAQQLKKTSEDYYLSTIKEI